MAPPPAPALAAEAGASVGAEAGAACGVQRPRPQPPLPSRRGGKGGKSSSVGVGLGIGIASLLLLQLLASAAGFVSPSSSPSCPWGRVRTRPSPPGSYGLGEGGGQREGTDDSGKAVVAPLLDVGLDAPIPWVTSARYLGVPWLPLRANMGFFWPPLNKRGVRYHLLELSTLLMGTGGVRFTNTLVYTTSVHQLVFSRAPSTPRPSWASTAPGSTSSSTRPRAPISACCSPATPCSYGRNSIFCRPSTCVLPGTPSSAALCTGLLWISAFQELLAPLFRLPMPPHLYVRLLDIGVMPLLR